MIVWINGRFVDEADAVVSVFDRAFLYGDGLFETLRICCGKPFRWQQHFDRLERGGAFLKLTLPFSNEVLSRDALELVQRNRMPEALLRVTLTRGVGLRGYSPRGAQHPTGVMFLHPVPEQRPAEMRRWGLWTSTHRLAANDPVAQFKTCNKLPQIMARMQADSNGAQEALLLNTDGYLVEGSSSNFFWIEGDRVCTAPLAAGVLAGVTRAVVAELCRKRGIEFCEKNIFPGELGQSQGVFLSLSSMGIVEGASLDNSPLPVSPLTKLLHDGYQSLLETESSSS